MEAVLGAQIAPESNELPVSPVLEVCQPVSLTVQSSQDPAPRQLTFRQANVLIGRRSGSDVVLDDLTVSGRHAEIIRGDEGFELRDLGSRNGTLLNTQPVDRVPLPSGTEFKVGIYTLTFTIDEVPVPASPAEAQAGVLEYLNGGMRGIKQGLQHSITKVSANGLVVVISRRKTGFFVAHLQGAERALLNGAAVGTCAVSLNHDDVLELGTTRIRFRLH